MSPRNNIGNSIKRKAKLGLVGLALAAPFIFIDRARGEGITGGVSASVSLDGVGGAGCGVAFAEGASYGLDDFDALYDELPSPDGIYVKAVGSIDGRPADGIVNPPIPKVTGSSGGASFSCSFVVGAGTSITLDNASYSFSASGSIDGCRVTVNGVDLSSGEDIPGGEISGTFGPGEHSIGDISINVEYMGTGGNGGDPNDPNPPDPNTPLDAGPHRLRIDNVHEQTNSTTYMLVLRKGAKDGTNDADDVIYPKIVDTILAPAVVSEVNGEYLSKDVRGTEKNHIIYLQQVVVSNYNGPIHSGRDTNALVFSFPENEGTNHKFGNRVMTFQQYIPDANEPNTPVKNSETYPVYLVRDLIVDGNGLGVITLPNFERYIYNGTLHSFVLRTDNLTKELAIGDFNKDGRVDVNDCNALTSAMGHAGNSVYDIASADPNDPNILYIGIRPDKKVDQSDKKAIYQLMDADKKRRDEAVENTQADRFGVISSDSFLRDKLRTTGRKIASLRSQ